MAICVHCHASITRGEEHDESCPAIAGLRQGLADIRAGRTRPFKEAMAELGIEVVAPRSFWLVRDEDVSGVSGTGIVATGVEFPDGVVALRWKGDWPTSVVFHERGIASVIEIHGHKGRTHIEWC